MLHLYASLKTRSVIQKIKTYFLLQQKRLLTIKRQYKYISTTHLERENVLLKTDQIQKHRAIQVLRCFNTEVNDIKTEITN